MNYLLLFAATAACINAEAIIKYLHALSEVQTRFASTDLVSEIQNLGAEPAKVTYSAELPPNAFIKSFYFEKDGKITYGTVKEKTTANEEFEAAEKSGKTAARIRESNFNSFELDVSLAPFAHISFNLTYQEILQKSHYLYKHVVNVKTTLPIKDLQINVLLADKQNFSLIHIPKFDQGIAELPNNELLERPLDPRVTTQSASDGSGSLVYISFDPTEEVTNGELVILYNTTIPEGNQEVQVVNGYFVHQFEPSADVRPGNKNVVFVLDKSGSMKGTKIMQLKESMNTILDELRPEDTVNIVLFDRKVSQWKDEPVHLTDDTKKEAQKYIDDMVAHGGTNMGAALRQSLDMLTSAYIKDPSFLSMVVFLTDGKPTVGEKNDFDLLNQISQYSKNFSIHSISFGNNADYTLMKKISTNHRGLARRIFENSDSGLQIRGFYEEIAIPLLKDVTIKYLDENVDSSSVVSPDDENFLFAGNEIINIGKLTDDPEAELNAIATSIEAQTDGGTEVVSKEVVPTPACYQDTLLNELGQSETRSIQICGADNSLGNFVERMWAHQTILKYQKVYESEAKTEDERNSVAGLIRQLALKYGFVTSQTSMVVVLEGEEKTLEESSDDLDELEDEPVTKKRLQSAELSENFRLPFLAKKEKYPEDCSIHLVVIMDKSWSKKINSIRGRKFGADFVRQMPSFVTVTTAEIAQNRSIVMGEGLEEQLFELVAANREIRKQVVLISEMSSSLERPLQYIQVLQPALTKLVIVNPFQSFNSEQKSLIREIDAVVLIEMPTPKDLARLINCDL